jgi:hypothetical protein
VSNNPLASQIVGGLAVAAVLAFIAFVLADGSGDDPTLEEWNRKASLACRAFADDTADIGQSDTNDYAENAKRARQWADAYRTTGDRVERIGTPRDYAAEVEEFTALFDALGDNFDAYATDELLGRNTLQEIRRNQRETTRLFDRWNALAKRLGARGCA